MLLGLQLTCFSQNEQSKWYFGYYAALDFMNGTPLSMPGSNMSVEEGCSSVADANGSLLFYTDGSTVYNVGNVAMANGNGLLGNASTTQGALIVKKPGSSTLYYVFTLGCCGNGALHYSIVDMSLVSGTGSVTIKNVPLIASGLSEKMAATRHCNGTDVWIVTHDTINNFLAFLLTPSGVIPTPVVSSSGSAFSPFDFAGNLKISPTCKKIGMAREGYSGGFDLFDFDNSTGVVSNFVPLLSLPASTVQLAGCYGSEFSPDGTKFYGVRITFPSPTLYQWDVCAGSTVSIIASQYTTTSAAFTWGLQLAMDGRIYGCTNTTTLCVIGSPNAAGAGCNYSSSGPVLFNGNNLDDPPNFMTSYNFQAAPPAAPFTYTVSPLFGCQTASFNSIYSPSSPTVLGCTSLGYSLTGMQWDFGDPVSGATNTSTLSSPGHVYSSVGTYTTQLILYYSCSRANDTLYQTVNITQPCITVSSTSITCSSLGSATVNTTNNAGSYGYTWMPTGQTSSVATGLSPGTYTITVHDLLNNLTFTASTSFIPLIPLTGQLANSQSISCNGVSTGTAAITNISGGSGNQSFLWTNGTTSLSTPSPTNLTGGLWTVIVTDALTGCQINSQFYISQPPPIVVLPSSNTPSVCLGGSIALTGTASGGIPALAGTGYTYNWSAGPSGNTQTVSPSLPGIYVYTLIATDSLGCTRSQTIALNFVPYPVVSASDVSICPLQVGTLTASGAASYTWNTGTTGSSFTAAPLSNQQCTVTGEMLGCSSTTVTNIYLLPVPVPTLSSNSPACEGGTLTLSAFGGTAYAWNGPNTFTASMQSPGINTVSLNAAGVYSVIVTAANSCTAIALQTVVINLLPTLTLSPSGSSICANTTSVTLTASGTATLFSWLPALGLSSATGAIVDASPSSTQVYTLSGALNGCNTFTTATVNVVPPPMPVAALSSASTCAEAFNGSPNTITLTAGGAAAYTITTPNDIYNSNSAGPITNLNTLPPHIPGVATATVYGSNGVCTLSTTAVFSIIPNPTVSVSNPTPVICAGDNYTYTSAGADSYVWSSSSPGQTLYTTGNVAVANPSINSVFSVFGGSLGCNSALQSTTITVNPLPEVDAGPNPAILCLNSAVTLTAVGNGTSYSWQPPYWLNTDNGATVIANPPSQQSYTVIASLNSCTASAMITVSVLPLPSLTVNSSAPDVLCLNQSFTLSAEGGISYSWHYPNGIIKTGPGITVVPTTILYAGSYTVNGTGTNGCQNTATVFINIENNPSGYLQSTALQGCVPLCGNYRFVATNLQSVTVTGWQINEQTLPAQNVFQHCFTTAGDYLIKSHLISSHGCANTLTFTVNAYPQPKAEFSFTPEHPVENMDAVNFTPYQDATITQFSWSFVNNDSKNQSSGIHPSYLFETAGTYPVALVVRNQWDCADSLVKTITVEPDFAVYVPNAFTPNEDDRNELFFPVTRGVSSISFIIFDRWGEKIFSTNSLNTGWDGTFKGQPCKQDVYVWKMEAVSFDHQVKKSTGFVTLLR